VDVDPATERDTVDEREPQGRPPIIDAAYHEGRQASEIPSADC
jgi:hypothetical protein